MTLTILQYDRKGVRQCVRWHVREYHGASAQPPPMCILQGSALVNQSDTSAGKYKVTLSGLGSASCVTDMPQASHFRLNGISAYQNPAFCTMHTEPCALHVAPYTCTLSSTFSQVQKIDWLPDSRVPSISSSGPPSFAPCFCPLDIQADCAGSLQAYCADLSPNSILREVSLIR